MTNVATNPGDKLPAGSARVLVRGLAASMEESARRLNAMAADRAATMATTIQTNWRAAGMPPAASIAPQSANGSAKIECSHLIISRVSCRFLSTATTDCKGSPRAVAVFSDQGNESAPLKNVDHRSPIDLTDQL